MTARSLTTVLTAAAILASAGPALPETRSLHFEIEPIIMLKCRERIDHRFDAVELLLAAGPTGPAFAGAQGRGTGDTGIEATFAAAVLLDQASTTTIDLEIEEACSVRGLGNGEGFLVEIETPANGRLVSDSSDGVLSVREALARVSAGERYRARFAIPQQRIRLDKPIEIDVKLTVDIGLAEASGLYSAPVDGIFSVEVSAP